MLERDLKQPVNVVNRTGGSGVVGHQAIATAAPDGYTFGLITLEITLMHWAGLTDLTYEKFTPLGLVNQDYAAIHVKADSPFKNVKELFAHIKANPNKVVASGSGQGGSWHLALAGLMQAAGTQRIEVGETPSACIRPASATCQLPPCPVPEAATLFGFALMCANSSLTVLNGESERTWIAAASVFISANGVNWPEVSVVRPTQCIMLISSVIIPMV